MKAWQFYTTTALAGLCALLAITLIVIGQANRSIQNGLQNQQAVIAKGQISQQIGQALVRDLAQASMSDYRIKDLLSKNGINVTPKN